MGGSGGNAVYIAGGTINTIGQIGSIRSIEAINNIEPIRFCHWAAPEWGDIGQTSEVTWYNVALIAVATINTIAQIQIAQKRYQIAKDYAKIAQDKWERFKNGYMPLEQAMLAEIMNTPIRTPNYVQARSDYGGFAKYSYGEAQSRLSRKAKQYRLCIDPSLVDDLRVAEGIAIDDGINFGYRYEEDYTQRMNDIRWNRRSNLLNLGRDIHAQSAQYANYANQMLAGLSDTANQGASGAMSMLGYLSERRDTYYPQNFIGVSGLSGDAGYSEFPYLFSGATMGPTADTI